jgi:hypothetical protein
MSRQWRKPFKSSGPICPDDGGTRIMLPPTLVAVCGDRGGANAVAPVLKALKAEERVTVQALAYGAACTIWADCQLAFTLLDGVATDVRLEPTTALLVTGTSSPNPLEYEKAFIAAARKQGIPSLAVLDSWSNYTQRFSDARGRPVYVPDRIAVMDEWARDEMIASGIDGERIVVTGQPAFDDLSAVRTRFTSARRQALRTRCGIGEREWMVLFVSQPLSLLFGSDASNRLYPGFDEGQVLRALVAALEQIVLRAAHANHKMTLVILPHPREQVETLQIESRVIRTVVATEHQPRELALAADLVVGMTSTLLVEACYLGCVTLSLQPGLRWPDTFPTNRWGASRAVYRQEDIRSAVEQLLLDESSRAVLQGRLATLALDTGATRRVTQLIYQMIEGG